MNTTFARIRPGLQFALAIVMVAALLVLPLQSAQAFTIPTFAVTNVEKDVSVTIKTANFPAHKVFTVRMGAYGTLGVGGTVVGSTDSGAGGTFTISYAIPAALAGKDRIAIRLDSADGYYSYNWFWNNPSTVTPVPGYSGIPTFSIVSVEKDNSVTIKTNNFPANKEFTVKIGKYGTLGIGGTVVATTNSGGGGTFTITYLIPEALFGSERLSIRMEAPGGFFAYNWFVNSPAAVTPAPTPGYSGIPTFTIAAVVKDDKVTIKTNNFPANKEFTVRIGKYGTLGVGGTVVATTNSGAGGAFTLSYDIPAGLKGQSRLAIRMDAPGGFFAYNWFWNSTTP